MENDQYRLARRMRWTGRIIGLVAAGFLLAMLIASAIAEAVLNGLEPITVEGILLGVLGAIALAGGILSWWRERLAGMILILVSAGLGIHIGIVAGRNHMLVWALLGLPYLLAGGLLLYSWRLSRKAL